MPSMKSTVSLNFLVFNKFIFLFPLQEYCSFKECPTDE